jgi:peptide chain release factor subunit 1
VDTLILSEKLRKVRLVMKCENCGWTKEETTSEDPIEFEKRYGPCPQCSQQAVAIETETDIVEELSAIAESMASKVKIISGNSDEGELFFKAFGGIGAILRFRVG